MKNSFDYNVLRQTLLQKRKAMSPAERQEKSQVLNKKLLDFLLENYRLHHLIAAFFPIRDEVDIKPLLLSLDEKGFRLALPKIIEQNAPLRFYPWNRHMPLVSGHFSIPEPASDTEISDIPDVVLTPLLGFTSQGDRLGYGKGYYDRTLAHWIQKGKDPHSIGICWDEGKILDPNYMPLSHDIPLKNILTPSGWVR